MGGVACGGHESAVLDGQGGSVASSRQVWTVVREQVAESPAALEDERRLRAVLSQRRSRSQEFFSSAAGQWTVYAEEFFGATFHLQRSPGWLDRTWTSAISAAAPAR